MLESQYLYAAVGLVVALLSGYQLRGWLDARKANAKQALLDEISEDLTALESFKQDSSAVQAESVRKATEAAKLEALKARFASLT